MVPSLEVSLTDTFYVKPSNDKARYLSYILHKHEMNYPLGKQLPITKGSLVSLTSNLETLLSIWTLMVWFFFFAFYFKMWCITWLNLARLRNSVLTCGLYWQPSALKGLSNTLPAKLAVLQSVPLFVIKIKVCLETSDNCMQVKSILSSLTQEQK